MPFVDAYADAGDGSLTLVWEHGGENLHIHGLGDPFLVIVKDVLLMKEAVDVGRDPADLHLRCFDRLRKMEWHPREYGDLPPSRRSKAASPSAAARKEIAAVPFKHLVEHLQDCMLLIDPPMPYGSFGSPTEAAELLRAAAFLGHTALVHLLLLLEYPCAFLDEMPEVFEQAYKVFGHEDGLSDRFKMCWSPLHTAAAGGSVACATALLQDDSGLATRYTEAWWFPVHVAAWHGHADVLQLLLDSEAVDGGASLDFNGCYPVHIAALGGRVACFQLLLQIAGHFPVSYTARHGETPLHLASMCMQPRDTNGSDHAAMVRLLLELTPDAVSTLDNTGKLPLASCAGSEQGSAEVFNMLLQAHPEGLHVSDGGGCLLAHCTARAGNLAVLRILHTLVPATFSKPNNRGQVPLHCAARYGQPDAVSYLLEILPDSAALADCNGRLPFGLALQQLNSIPDEYHFDFSPAHAAARLRQLKTVCRLLPTVSFSTALSALAGAHEDADQLLPDAVICHLPLSEADWLLIVEPCPDLGRALPAALQRGQSQAGQLVRRLPQAERARLRTAALSMARAQKLAAATLPPEMTACILALSLSE